jgi:bifunctional UDP-N-acetylglucosamine pyrophosphorylase / glucosamine-1-phosphate N-acetyltransferase
MADRHVVVLAAGKGTRMRSAQPKVLHRVGGRTLLDWVLRIADGLAPQSTTLVVGHEADAIRESLRARPSVRIAIQEPQLGTAHALLQTEPELRGATGTVVLLYGDVPMLRTETVRRLVDQHEADRAAATVLTAVVDRPYGYGRIVRLDGRIARVVEERDASPAERAIKEINSGLYAFDLGPLFEALKGVASRNAQGEYYLPDLVSIYRKRRRRVGTLLVDDPDEIRGINSRSELAETSKAVRQKKNEELMASGVTLVDPATTYVEPDVVVGADTVIHPGVHLEGKTVIGAACELHAGVRIVDSTLGDRVAVLNHCLIVSSTIADAVSIGPFAHLRPASDVREGAHIGNFVELKKTVLGAGAKAGHLTYLGDATVGSNVNIGAGTITCNYDGERKHPTIIEEGAFVGSDSALVAPVTIGRGAYVAAGSTITQDVPAGALGIARGRQANVEGWVERKKARKGQ